MGRAVPEAWIEKLFARMVALWGSRFADMWRDADLDEVKATWRAGLANVNDDGLKRGVAALFHEQSPPTLPRFLELCAAQPAMYRQTALIDEAGRTAPGEARAHLAAIAKRIGAAAPGIAWARNIVDEAANGHVLPGNRLQVALDAIATFETTHGKAKAQQEPEISLPPRVPSPHIYTPEREPGTDDDLEVA